jgi:transglutaminase-like putative cysteine protease
MYYRIRHLTRFRYSAPVTESLMEVRMHPRTEGHQRCLDYQLAVTPKASTHTYRDFLGNSIHHFGIPGAHRQLQIMAESVVEMKPWHDLPYYLAPGAWAELDRMVHLGDTMEMLLPSHFAKPTPALESLMRELDAVRRDDPLSVLRELNTRIFEKFEYVPRSTRVDSPIDDALNQRAGVCQDFSHIMIAMVRQLGIPCRYVSGYLHHREQDHDRSSDGATHAWVEALLPELGWVGFDPTNNLLSGHRHIRTAIGRDYSDVPPARGVFKGEARSELSVTVEVRACRELPPELAELVVAVDEAFPLGVMALANDEAEVLAAIEREQQMQQQQQQQ